MSPSPRKAPLGVRLSRRQAWAIVVAVTILAFIPVQVAKATGESIASTATAPSELAAPAVAGEASLTGIAFARHAVARCSSTSNSDRSSTRQPPARRTSSRRPSNDDAPRDGVDQARRRHRLPTRRVPRAGLAEDAAHRGSPDACRRKRDDDLPRRAAAELRPGSGGLGLGTTHEGEGRAHETD